MRSSSRANGAEGAQHLGVFERVQPALRPVALVRPGLGGHFGKTVAGPVDLLQQRLDDAGMPCPDLVETGPVFHLAQGGVLKLDLVGERADLVEGLARGRRHLVHQHAHLVERGLLQGQGALQVAGECHQAIRGLPVRRHGRRRFLGSGLLGLRQHREGEGLALADFQRLLLQARQALRQHGPCIGGWAGPETGAHFLPGLRHSGRDLQPHRAQREVGRQQAAIGCRGLEVELALHRQERLRIPDGRLVEASVLGPQGQLVRRLQTPQQADRLLEPRVLPFERGQVLDRLPHRRRQQCVANTGGTGGACA
ncbi:hypothetical protein [Ideonella sp. YS5]|uniref:hypothetical protein n=1 Tax=Ideonella sp. YS5 TaxID=3453714 RepID=UPI003EE84E69